MCIDIMFPSDPNINGRSTNGQLKVQKQRIGATASHFAKIADEDDMWIIYGATETIEKDGKVDTKHAYNSAFVCSPDGEVTTYQKITPVEGSWCTSGETPVIIDAGEYGKLGISILLYTYSTPELEKYYYSQWDAIS